jgi:hypothetical protein
MMWGSDYPHSESTFPQSRKILAEILAGVPDDEQAKPAPDPDPGIAGGNTARVYNFDVAKLTVPARRGNLSADQRVGMPALYRPECGDSCPQGVVPSSSGSHWHDGLELDGSELGKPAEATRLTGGRHSGQLAANDA